MQSKLRLVFVAIMLQAIPILSQIEVTDYGDIPSERLAAGRWANYQWQDPGNWEIIDVTKRGIQPNSSDNMASKLQDLIDNGSGNRIFKFPAGNFNIRTNIEIKNNIQIIGSGKATKFLAVGGEFAPSINIRGSRTGNYKMVSDAPRGADKITLNNTDGISPGTYIFISQPGTGPRGDAETQAVKVLSKSGNTLTIDTRLGIPFYGNKATIQKYGDSQNVKLSNFYFERVTKPVVNDNNKRSDNFRIINARNVEISNIELNKVLSSHISISRSTEIVLKGNYIHGNYGGGGGTQGGILASFCSKIYAINNRTSNIRHHITTQFGTNHCVIAYNRAEAPYNAYQDIGQHNSKGCHNNLFEGNYGRQIFDDPNEKKGWGTRYTMFYRNHATDIIGAMHEASDHNNIIGNEFKKSSQGSAIAEGTDNLVGANIFGVNNEGGDGNLVWKDLNPGAALPPSLFLKSKPSYANRWPLYGPDATTGPNAIGPEGYSYAVNESETIQISDIPYDVAYGQDGNYEYLLEQTANVICNNDTFGNDPVPGTPKYCFVRESKVPFAGESFQLPGIIEAENFDFGGQGRSYMDVDPENRGEIGFREESGVDIDKGADGNGYAVGWMATGEWLEYTVKVTNDGMYGFNFLVASPNGAGILSLDVDGEKMISGFQVPQTGGWDLYSSFSTSVPLSQGGHLIRIHVEKNGFNLDKIEVIAQSLGITDLTKKMIKVSPNPSVTGIFNISRSLSYKVYAISGRQLVEQYSDQVDLSGYPNGIYILKYENAIMKLVK